jgi:hypothetical protein
MVTSILGQVLNKRQRLKGVLPMPQVIEENQNEKEKTRKTTEALLNY